MKKANQIFGSIAFSMKHSTKPGFSFMELMIVVTIVGIMTSVGLVAMNGNKNETELKTEARKVVVSIRQAQNYALTGKTSVNGLKTCGRVRWRSLDSETYKVKIWTANPADGTGCGGYSDDVTYNLENGVTFNTFDDRLDFIVPFGGLADSSPDPDSMVTVRKGSSCIDIEVSEAGVVTEGQLYTCP